MSAPMTMVISVAMSPIVIEILAPWTVRLSMSLPTSSVPRMCTALGGSSGLPVAVTIVCSGPTNKSGAIATIVNAPRITSPTSPSERPRTRPTKSRACRPVRRNRPMPSSVPAIPVTLTT